MTSVQGAAVQSRPADIAAASQHDIAPMGQWTGDQRQCSFGPFGSAAIARSVREPTGIIFDPTSRRLGLAWGGNVTNIGAETAHRPLLGLLAPLYPEWLGDRAFTEAHGLRFAYMGGSMARGIASTDLVIALARMGALGMYGAAGMAPAAVEAAIGRMQAALDPLGLPWGCNLIHSPGEAGLEESLVDLFLAADVRRIEASAFMSLSKAVVRYACSGLHVEGDRIVRRRHVFAKVSREEQPSFKRPIVDRRGAWH